MSRPSWIGKTLGNRYQIQEILGQGGMSAVYKALDPNLQRVVAIKLIHPHLSEDPKFISRFEEEARSVAQLRHPNITQVFDFNHDGDVYYMVQEFLPGETLQERLRRLNRDGRRMPLAEVIRYTLDICSAMGYAHERGLIHRDIKPANIMLDVQGKAILMDFGIVKIVGGSSHTTTGAVVGTAMYMSPDVIRGQAPDARSDIYSLGVTLFEMVSGRAPFQADSAMSLMMMHLHDPLPDLHGLRPETPDDLIAIIDKSLAKGRDERYQTAQEMGAALKRALDRLEGGAGQGPGAGRPAAGLIIAEPGRHQPRAAGVGGGTRRTEAGGQACQTARAHPARSRAGPARPAAGPAAPHPRRTWAPTRLEASAARPATPPGGYPAAGATPPSATGPGRPATGSAAKPALARPALLAGGGAALFFILLCLAAGGLGGAYLLNRGGFFARASETPIDYAGSHPDQPGRCPPSDRSYGFAYARGNRHICSADPDGHAGIHPNRYRPGRAYLLPASMPSSWAAGDSTFVYYETFEYTEQLPGVHVHFFFNTVPPEQAGNPGKGPWILYGGPRPFTGYKTSDRPTNASQMCILVANADHSVQPNSGGCLPLPDVPTATARQDDVCRAGPDEVYSTAWRRSAPAPPCW